MNHTIYQDNQEGCVGNVEELYTKNADALIISIKSRDHIKRQMRLVRLRGTARIGAYSDSKLCPLTFEPITLENQPLEDVHVFTRAAVQIPDSDEWSCEGQTWELLGIRTYIVPESVNKYAAFDAANILGV